MESVTVTGSFRTVSNSENLNQSPTCSWVLGPLIRKDTQVYIKHSIVSSLCMVASTVSQGIHHLSWRDQGETHLRPIGQGVRSRATPQIYCICAVLGVASTKKASSGKQTEHLAPCRRTCHGRTTVTPATSRNARTSVVRPNMPTVRGRPFFTQLKQ